jgi:hypothetical protein
MPPFSVLSIARARSGVRRRPLRRARRGGQPPVDEVRAREGRIRHEDGGRLGAGDERADLQAHLAVPRVDPSETRHCRARASTPAPRRPDIGAPAPASENNAPSTPAVDTTRVEGEVAPGLDPDHDRRPPRSERELDVASERLGEHRVVHESELGSRRQHDRSR